MFTFLSENEITSTANISLYEDEPLSLTSENAFDNLLDRNPSTSFSWSAGTGTNTCLHVTLAGNYINTVMLKGINFTDFEIQINSASVTPIGADTTTAHWDSWTDENLFLQFSSIAANTLEIIVYTASSADRICAEVLACNEVYALPRNPNFADYNPALTGNRIEKQMADGGTTNILKTEKFKASFNLNYMPQSVANDILDLYRTLSAYEFAPFPTTSGWDGQAYEVNLTGDYTFLKPAVNDMTTPYYSGQITIKETPA